MSAFETQQTAIVCALECEARPLISHYNLKLVEGQTPFSLYLNKDMCLIITGVSKLQAAAATAYAFAKMGERRDICWLNVGISGHRSLDIGTSFMAHQVINQSSGHTYYPFFIKKPPCQRLSLITVEKPESQYLEESAYDMEAAGFYTSAMLFSSVELVHCYKVISDNAIQPWHAMSKHGVEALIAAKLEEIDGVIKDVKAQIKVEASSDLKDEIFTRWYFTATQRHRLQRLLLRWKACSDEDLILDNEISLLKNAKEVLNYLDDKINKLPLSFEKSSCSSPFSSKKR